MSAMTTLEAGEIADVDFSPFGFVYHMEADGKNTGGVRFASGDGWEDAHTAFPLLDTSGSLGYTLGTGTPFVLREMERHLHTQEALFPIDQPIVFCVARAGESAPRLEDVLPVILRPGYVAVLHRATWHSSAHGLFSETHYHWMALSYANEPTVWMDLADGPARVVTKERV